MNQKDFLLKLAEAYQKYDASIINPYLAEDMHYASMWVFHEMTSKLEYMDYLVGKLETMKKKWGSYGIPNCFRQNAQTCATCYQSAIPRWKLRICCGLQS